MLRSAGEWDSQSVGGDSADGEGGESDFGEHDDMRCRKR